MAAPTPRPRNLQLLTARGVGKDGVARDSGGRKISGDPGFKRIAPRKPADMTPDASAMWDQIIEELARVALLKEADGGALYMLCESFSRWKAARDVRAAEGVLAETLSGTTIRHPATLAEEAASKEYLGWCREFGLTPSAEVRLKIKSPDAAPEADAFG